MHCVLPQDLRREDVTVCINFSGSASAIKSGSRQMKIPFCDRARNHSSVTRTLYDQKPRNRQRNKFSTADRISEHLFGHLDKFWYNGSLCARTFDIETQTFFSDIDQTIRQILPSHLLLSTIFRNQYLFELSRNELSKLWPILEARGFISWIHSDHFDIPLLNNIIRAISRGSKPRSE